MEKYISSELPVVGSIVQTMEEDGVESDEGFDGTCFLRLWNDEGNWKIVNWCHGLICFLDKRYRYRRIHAVETETQREKAAIERPTHYDLPKCYCPGGNDPNCNGWRHWFHMSHRAKELMLETNPSFAEEEVYRKPYRPPYIPVSWGYWEAMAEIESAKEGGKSIGGSKFV